MAPSELNEVLARLDRIERLLIGPAPSSDFDINTDPRDWKGASYKGKKMSEAPREYLDMLAGMYDFFAEKSEKESAVLKNGNPKAPWDRKLAETARQWAKHAKSGAPIESQDSPDNTLPF